MIFLFCKLSVDQITSWDVCVIIHSYFQMMASNMKMAEAMATTTKVTHLRVVLFLQWYFDPNAMLWPVKPDAWMFSTLQYAVQTSVTISLRLFFFRRCNKPTKQWIQRKQWKCCKNSIRRAPKWKCRRRWVSPWNVLFGRTRMSLIGISRIIICQRIFSPESIESSLNPSPE